MKLKYTFRNIRLHIVSMLAALTVAGCADEKILDGPVPVGDDLVMSISCKDMLPQYSDPLTAQSRATDPKTESEKKINTLHLFFFAPDVTGKLVFVRPALDDITFYPYQVIDASEGKSTEIVTVKENVFETMNNVTVVAIANINATDDAAHNYFCTEWTPDGAICKDSRSGEPFRIESYDDLKQWIYHPRLRSDERRSISELPAAGMPMIGVAENVSLVKSAGNTRLEVQLRALMARVNISIKLNPDQQSTDGALPTMRITSYGIRNMPYTVPFVAPAATFDANEKAYDLTDMTEGRKGDFEYVLPAPVIINKDSKAETFSYYTYENIQLPDYNAKRPDGDAFFPDYNNDTGTGTERIVYPNGVSADDYQRWKPVMARKDEASAMVLNGVYTTHQGINYRAQFTIYMGANPENDFCVRRNHEYNNNITVRGLDYVRNSTDDVYTFDARVNVATENPIYVALVNERKIDAHATALPMDIWLMPREPQNGVEPVVDFTTKVTLKIDDKDKDWITMMLVPRDEMEKGNFAAGTGLVKYFYNDLVSECNNGTGSYTEPGTNATHTSGTEISITCLPTNAPGYTNESRSRIYFYIDENVPTEQTVANNTYGDRMATVKLTYETTSASGARLDYYERTIEIEQRALVHVQGRHPSDDKDTDTWMEYYEEYLEHSDPLDKHVENQALYNGLPWGLNNVAVNNVVRGVDGYDTYSTEQAFRYTQGILKRDGAVPLSNFTLHAKPVTAFHYCYGRNKRNSDGSVDLSDNKKTGWYMPGIRELEVAITKFYLDFDDFRGNLYLSAACGRASYNGYLGTFLRNEEELGRARATKVVFDAAGNPGYVESEVKYKNQSLWGNPAIVEDPEGAVLRIDPHRIRAFYKMK